MYGWIPKFWVNLNFDINLILFFKKEFKKHIFLTFFSKITDKINLKFKTKMILTFMKLGPGFYFLQSLFISNTGMRSFMYGQLTPLRKCLFTVSTFMRFSCHMRP